MYPATLPHATPLSICVCELIDNIHQLFILAFLIRRAEGIFARSRKEIIH